MERQYLIDCILASAKEHPVVMLYFVVWHIQDIPDFHDIILAAMSDTDAWRDLYAHEWEFNKQCGMCSRFDAESGNKLNKK